MNYKNSVGVALGIWLFGVSPCFSSTVNFDGTLIEDACDVYPGDESIELDFGTIVNKYLYLNTRTHSQEFKIRLINCDLSLGHEVKVTFSGEESPELSGLLAVNSGGQTSGIAVGLETLAGTKLNINQGIFTQQLYVGNNNLNFKAYIQGEPLALKNKSVNLGPWSATATFKLDYE